MVPGLPLPVLPAELSLLYTETSTASSRGHMVIQFSRRVTHLFLLGARALREQGLAFFVLALLVPIPGPGTGQEPSPLGQGAPLSSRPRAFEAIRSAAIAALTALGTL